MANRFYKVIKPEDTDEINMIANWYLNEWSIPIEATEQKIKHLSSASFEFQVLMYLNKLPIATCGVYNHVGLIDKEPKFAAHRHWLALLYTLPAHRGNGFGASLCEHIQVEANIRGLAQLYLFTHTAQSLYTRLGWQEAERIVVNGKNIAVMKKEL